MVSTLVNDATPPTTDIERSLISKSPLPELE